MEENTTMESTMEQLVNITDSLPEGTNLTASIPSSEDEKEGLTAGKIAAIGAGVAAVAGIGYIFVKGVKATGGDIKNAWKNRKSKKKGKDEEDAVDGELLDETTIDDESESEEQVNPEKK